MKLSRKSWKTGVTWVWYGGNGIHGYIDKKEVAFLSIRNDSSKDEIRKKLIEIANLSPEEQSSYASDESLQKLIKNGKQMTEKSKEILNNRQKGRMRI